ncbi:cold-shock protein [Rufibacter latericius]|uniref:Cold shock domain-containing protein n=1 Tax=Rufibacter latericius TaxID=2487040 RepID=A0A3M9MMZ6_9BACT|nr:cold shock domain-containing protein [Rufibacter latericius]RNI26916.1 cold shock domain-containing protein [Rufibacter latericius]
MKHFGFVKDFNIEKGYGFIGHNGQDYFFHQKNAQSATATLISKVVHFQLIDSKKHVGKKEAVDVSLLTLAEDFDQLLAYINGCDKGFRQKLLSNLTFTELKKLFNKITSRIHKIDSLGSYEIVVEFLSGLKVINQPYQDFTAYIHSICSPDFQFRLWLDNLSNSFNEEYVINSLGLLDTTTLDKVLKVGNETVNKAYFLSELSHVGRIDTEGKKGQVFSLFNKLSQLHKSSAFINELKTLIRDWSSSHFKIIYWLEGFDDYFDFHEFKPYVSLLEPSKQKIYVKKILSLIHRKEQAYTLQDILSIKDNVIDYGIAQAVQGIDGSKLDFSVSIILQTLEDLSNHAKPEMGKIYDIIVNQFVESSDVLQVTGFFNECAGRYYPKISKVVDEETLKEMVTISYQRNDKQKPFEFCEGRKAVNVATKEEALCERTNAAFWWCNNQKCYQNSLALRKPEEWERYTLLDFLSILNIKFDSNDYEIFLGYINKANKFLKHLNCRACKSIMRPAEQSNFAVNRITKFRCNNEACVQYLPVKGKDENKTVYISRCINKDCNDVIDSRDSVRCVPEGKAQGSCGWYICNNCNACCATDKIDQRKHILQKTGQSYSCHDVGHRGIQISCNKCGHKMEGNDQSSLYATRLEWFIQNREVSKSIRKSGQNNSGKWWFLLERGKYTYDEFKEKLASYSSCGFYIPDLDKEKDLQLLVEGSTAKLGYEGARNLKCTSCSHEISLSKEIDKFNVMKKYHKQYLFAVV